ncbi:integrase domain-containing protein [Vibrio astriarenae]
MGDAGRNAMKEACEAGRISHSTAQQNGNRWCQFANYIKEHFSINDSRSLNNGHIQSYADNLIEKSIEEGVPSTSSIHDMIASVNAVIAQMRGDDLVRVTAQQAGVPNRDHIATTSRACSQTEHDAAIKQMDDRTAAMADIQREIGLRFEESAKCNPKDLLKQAYENNRSSNGQVNTSIKITDGTKGGRPRDVILQSQGQLDALKQASIIQGSHHSMIPSNQSFSEFKSQCYQQYSKIDGYSPHMERHAFAHNEYTGKIDQITHQQYPLVDPPVNTRFPHGKEHIGYIAKTIGCDVSTAKMLDQVARWHVVNQLGHSREDIANSYLG